MKFLKEFSNWNPSLNKYVLDFIEKNKTYLIANLYDIDKSDEENEQELINLFTEYPDLMKQELQNIKTTYSQIGMKNAAPILMNIGGVKDFRSF
jgi:hypothetical protein